MVSINNRVCVCTWAYKLNIISKTTLVSITLILKLREVEGNIRRKASQNKIKVWPLSAISSNDFRIHMEKFMQSYI